MVDEGVIREQREVSGFNRVMLKEFGKLIVTQGKEENLTIEGQPEILKRITVEVKDSELILGLEGSFLDRFSDFISNSLSVRQITFHLGVRDLRGLNISGAGSATADNITTDAIELKLSGAGSIKMKGLATDVLSAQLPGTGKIELAGKADKQKVTITGAGGYIARELETKDAEIHLSGAGKGIVWATDALDISITGLGSVDYYGNPNLKQKITGLGNVVGLGEP